MTMAEVLRAVERAVEGLQVLARSAESPQTEVRYRRIAGDLASSAQLLTMEARIFPSPSSESDDETTPEIETPVPVKIKKGVHRTCRCGNEMKPSGPKSVGGATVRYWSCPCGESAKTLIPQIPETAESSSLPHLTTWRST